MLIFFLNKYLILFKQYISQFKSYSLAKVLNIYAKASNLSQPWHLCFDLVKSFMLPLYKQELFQPVCVCARTWSPDRNSQRPCRVQMASPLVMSHHHTHL